MIHTAINGLCTAIADSVPGVSGGTVAFILGFYDRFINSIHDLFGKERKAQRAAFIYLCKLGIGWAVGMGCCAILLSGLFTKNIYFMSSLFLGLTLASIPFIVRSEKNALHSGTKNIPYAVLGVVIVVGITLLRTSFSSTVGVNFTVLEPLNLFYILITGIVAIFAMVLPGISGSTVLLISGVYLPAIDAIKKFLHFDLSGFPGLAALGLGVLIGIGISIHFIRRALRRHRSKMVYLILGLMAGSLFAIVMGPATLSEPLPALALSTFSLWGFILGVVILFTLELLGSTTAKSSRRKAAKQEV